MDKRGLSSYAYHNCEFLHAIELVRDGEPSAEQAAVHVRALTELDRKDEAHAVAAIYAERFPADGLLRYLVGFNAYLAGRPKPEIEAAFLAAVERGSPAGAIGLAFLEATEQHFTSAVQLLRTTTGDTPELEHARRLSLFQALTLDEQLDAAEAELAAADRLLAGWPSLLRHLWGQICWIRLLRARGRFDGALALVERLQAQLAEERAPALWRNAREARRMIDAKSDAPNLRLPANGPPREAGPRDARRDALARIARKPMLHSLFVYLEARGRAGATKEDIVQNVWEESYNPVIHDDRIYKAVGRLRKLLGDDLQAPERLTQMGRNYVLNLPGAPAELIGD